MHWAIVPAMSLAEETAEAVLLVMRGINQVFNISPPIQQLDTGVAELVEVEVRT